MGRTRRRDVSNLSTLDQKHCNMVAELTKRDNEYQQKKKELREYEMELERLSNIHPNNYTHNHTREKSQLLDEIEYIKRDIQRIENCDDHLDYIDKTVNILIDYYDPNNTINDEYTEPTETKIFKNSVLSYFNDDVCEPVKPKPKQNMKSRKKLFGDYLDIIDIEYSKNNKQNNNKCEEDSCDGILVLCNRNRCYVCDVCGVEHDVLLTNDKPNYKDNNQNTSTYEYKRINHLTEILSQLQAKESTDIPSNVYDMINRELRKRNINKNTLDIASLRRLLKKLGFRKYYEHIPHILQVINGKKPPDFTREEEILIKKMFAVIQEPFALYRPEKRKNFLNYYYVLHKFCELLGLDEYIEYFPLLKNNSKLLEHDQIWKKICAHMKWEYYPSI